MTYMWLLLACNSPLWYGIHTKRNACPKGEHKGYMRQRNESLNRWKFRVENGARIEFPTSALTSSLPSTDHKNKSSASCSTAHVSISLLPSHACKPRQPLLYPASSRIQIFFAINEQQEAPSINSSQSCRFQKMSEDFLFEPPMHPFVLIQFVNTNNEPL